MHIVRSWEEGEIGKTAQDRPAKDSSAWQRRNKTDAGCGAGTAAPAGSPRAATSSPRSSPAAPIRRPPRDTAAPAGPPRAARCERPRTPGTGAASATRQRKTPRSTGQHTRAPRAAHFRISGTATAWARHTLCLPRTIALHPQGSVVPRTCLSRGFPKGIWLPNHFDPRVTLFFFLLFFWIRSICQSPPLLQKNVRKRYPFLSVYCEKGQTPKGKPQHRIDRPERPAAALTAHLLHLQRQTAVRAPQHPRPPSLADQGRAAAAGTM